MAMQSRMGTIKELRKNTYNHSLGYVIEVMIQEIKDIFFSNIIFDGKLRR